MEVGSLLASLPPGLVHCSGKSAAGLGRGETRSSCSLPRQASVRAARSLPASQVSRNLAGLLCAPPLRPRFPPREAACAGRPGHKDQVCSAQPLGGGPADAGERSGASCTAADSAVRAQGRTGSKAGLWGSSLRTGARGAPCPQPAASTLLEETPTSSSSRRELDFSELFCLLC